MVLLIVLVFLPSILLFLYRHRLRLRRSFKPTILTSRADILDLLGRHKSSLTTRALPNRRLIDAFGINNSFTTTNKKRHRAFSSQVAQYINPRPSDWAETSIFAASLLPPAHSTTLHLVPFIREYVLTVILYLFFPEHQGTSKDIADLGALIISLWVASKCACPSAEMKAALRSTLCRVFPTIDPEGDDSPLNILLPAYETLWRVVLRCFLEVQFRGSDNWREALVRYAREPSMERFEMGWTEGSSVAFVVRETLRLYPPTKRVYRSTSEDTVAAADIEALQLDVDVWGADAGEFRPERWGQDGCGDLMSFGAGWSVCPAGNMYAPRLIGILVGVLLEHVPGSAVQKTEREQDFVGEGGRLGNERAGYETLVLSWGEGDS